MGSTTTSESKDGATVPHRADRPSRSRSLPALHDRSPDEVLGEMHPSRAAASVGNVAVNARWRVARPQYMPLLLAIATSWRSRVTAQARGEHARLEAMIIVQWSIREAARLDCGQGCCARAPGEYEHRALLPTLSPATCRASRPERPIWHVRSDVPAVVARDEPLAAKLGLVAAQRDARLRAGRQRS